MTVPNQDCVCVVECWNAEFLESSVASLDEDDVVAARQRHQLESSRH